MRRVRCGARVLPFLDGRRGAAYSDLPGWGIRAQRHEHLDAAQIGKVQAEQDQVGYVLEEGAQTFRRIPCNLNRVTGRRQIQTQQVDEKGVILDQENGRHEVLPVSNRRSKRSESSVTTRRPAYEEFDHSDLDCRMDRRPAVSLPGVEALRTGFETTVIC